MSDWAIKLNDTTDLFRLEDLSPAEVQSIARRYGMSWFDLIEGPGVDLDALADVVELVATKQNQEWPGRKATVREARRLLDLLVKAPPDMPDMYEESVPLEGDQTTE